MLTLSTHGKPGRETSTLQRLQALHLSVASAWGATTHHTRRVDPLSCFIICRCVPRHWTQIMNPYLQTFLVVSTYVIYALATIIKWITYPFRPILYLLYVLVLPFIHVGQGIWALFSYPARLLPGSLVEVRYACISLSSASSISSRH